MNLLLAGIAGAAIVVVAAWRLIRNVVTAAHEAGHALAAIMLGGRLSKIRVRFNSSGETVCSVPKSRIRASLCAASGYPAPSIFGAAMFAGVLYGWERFMVGAAAALLCLSVPFWRGTWTVVVGASSTAVLGAGAYFGNGLALVVAGFVAGIGVLGGLRSASEAVRAPTNRHDSSDVAKVAKGLFMTVAVAKAGLVATMLASTAVSVNLVRLYLTHGVVSLADVGMQVVSNRW